MRLVILHESIVKEEGIEEEQEKRGLLVNVSLSNQHEVKEMLPVVSMEKKENKKKMKRKKFEKKVSFQLKNKREIQKK
jgi:hypothetical protein